MKDKLYNVGIYLRLSVENTHYRGTESMSITNQQAMLSKFISMMPGWVETRTYIDNGASGGNFNRKGFQNMIDDVKNGVINLILSKDLSRIGRNYLESGKYLEEILPSLGCRFVAPDDGVDTENGDNDIIPFLNAMNDYYLKNLSDKIKATNMVKAKSGHKLGGAAPYGYIRNPDDHARIIVDEYAAGVVRRIFELRTTGMGYAKIAKALNDDGILPPRLYYCIRNNLPQNACSEHWHDLAVRRVLHKEVYIGTSVSFMQRTISHRDSRLIPCSEDKWLRVENAHEAIISKSTWEKVQSINNEVRVKHQSSREPLPSLFTKLIICADCKRPMLYDSDNKTYANGDPVRYGGYYCGAYRKTGGSACSWHRISESILKTIVLDNIKRQAELITLDEEAMLQHLKEKLIGQYSGNKADMSKTIRDLQKRLNNAELQIEQLYEDKVTGTISNDSFMSLALKTETERQEAESQLTLLTQSKTVTEQNLKDINTWIRLIKEKSVLTDIDRDMLEALIDKIEVGEKRVINSKKTQDIRIFYKFVGEV